MLNWANQFGICCFLDSNAYDFKHSSYECVAGVGAINSITARAGNALQQLKIFQQQHNGWLFGHLAYDLKNELEQLYSKNPDYCQFPDLFFFIPQYVLFLNQQQCSIYCNNAAEAAAVFEAINNTAHTNTIHTTKLNAIESRFSRQEYLHTIDTLKQHIARGDCYELNFCQEFYAEKAIIDPVAIFNRLSIASPNPFAAFYKLAEKYLLCASPERYLKKQGEQILSQPIKGTGKRNTNNAAADELSKQYLLQSQKERAENVMVVDIVRNDLSKVCKNGSVTVDELFGLYSFPQVHQMISTITGQLLPHTSFVDIIKASFPMGSMTGAPKKRVMELIERYEKTRRGIYSGSVGYITPNGDFDFNVVIRSIVYNKSSQYLSYQVGSGITHYCKAEEEYEECKLKASAIEKILLQ
ncbi:MAG: anthranilate synthase component I family protein [Flavihumibacter sp.]|nr:anthranilate synthase component I family protein [Flavihumibacter sp.]